MRHIRTKLGLTLVTTIAIALSGSGQGTADDDMSDHHGMYLGQSTPGSSPELFAPGAVSG